MNNLEQFEIIERQLDPYNSLSFTAAYNFYQGIISSSRDKIQKNMNQFVFEKWLTGRGENI